jgi:hypothetical protein
MRVEFPRRFDSSGELQSSEARSSLATSSPQNCQRAAARMLPRVKNLVAQMLHAMRKRKSFIELQQSWSTA